MGKSGCVNHCELVSCLVFGALSRVEIGVTMGIQIDVAIITVCYRTPHWSVCHTRQNFGWESVKGLSAA